MLDQLAFDPLTGNVRELENLLHRAIALSEHNDLQLESPTQLARDQLPKLTAADSAPMSEVPSTIPSDLQSHLDNQEREILIQALRETGFNRTVAAARLGISLRQMRYRITRLRIDTPNSNESADETN